MKNEVFGLFGKRSQRESIFRSEDQVTNCKNNERSVRSFRSL